MKRSNLVTEIFLGMHNKDNNLYQISMFYRNSKEINNLLYEQSRDYLEKDIYKYINASNLVKNNIDIAKLILNIDAKFIHYIGEDIRDKFN